jgi:hypothetical protein
VRSSEAACVAPISAFVPAEVKAALVERARLDDRSVSAEIRIALVRHLDAKHEGAAK